MTQFGPRVAEGKRVGRSSPAITGVNMKRIAVFFLFAATACWGADQKTDQKRLENVTWDLKHHKLIWTIQTGNVGKDGEFLQGKTETYEISPDDATMLVHD